MDYKKVDQGNTQVIYVLRYGIMLYSLDGRMCGLMCVGWVGLLIFARVNFVDGRTNAPAPFVRRPTLVYSLDQDED